MKGDVPGLMASGRAALAAARWVAARDAFGAVLLIEEDADARFGRGVARWWLGDTEHSLRDWQRAYVGFRRRHDPAQAVFAAIYLCLAYRMSLGNDAAARGWLGRATRLVDDHGLADERGVTERAGPERAGPDLAGPDLAGWLLLCRAHLAIDAGRPGTAEPWAREAHERAQAAGDTDLELCALSELGAALVDQGRVDDGAALLDEAMAAALGGEGRDLDAVVLVSCRTITACRRAGELRRATQWVRAADAFYERHGSPHLYTTCRTQYGALLFESGDWQRAERELQAALDIGRAAEPLLHSEALATLAELRLAQGRPDEAGRLLAACEDLPSAAGVRAKVHLARREPSAAAALARRRLRQVAPTSMEAASLLELLGEAEVEQGELARAAERAAALRRLGAELGSDVVHARGERLLGRVAMAASQAAEAVDHLENAVEAFGRGGMPLDAARARLLLATALHVRSGRTDGREPRLGSHGRAWQGPSDSRPAGFGHEAVRSRRTASRLRTSCSATPNDPTEGDRRCRRRPACAASAPPRGRARPASPRGGLTLDGFPIIGTDFLVSGRPTTRDWLPFPMNGIPGVPDRLA